MPKKFETVEERRSYSREWYKNNKHREDYKVYDRAAKTRIRRARRAWFTEYKKTLSCEKCGLSDFRVLDFHHKDPRTKDTEVTNLVNARSSIAKIKKEIDKCICLCANCHRIEHWQQKNK